MGIFPAPSGQNVDPNANITPLLYSTSAVFMTLSLLGVALRFTARKLAKIPLLLDDWLILAALPFAWVTCLVNVYGCLHNGQGRHINYSTLDSLHRFYQATFVFEMAFNFTAALSKLLLIYFYSRIFSTANYTRPFQVLAALVVMWLIATTFTVIFTCNPISGFWNIELPSQCINERAYFIAQAVPNMTFDVALLILPAIAVSKLQITTPQKFAIAGIFGVGIIVLVAAGVRLSALVYLADAVQFDVTYDLVPSSVWSVVECNLSVLCACLPCMRPLLRFVMTGSGIKLSQKWSMRSEKSSGKSSGKGSGKGSGKKPPPPPAALYGDGEGDEEALTDPHKFMAYENKSRPSGDNPHGTPVAAGVPLAGSDSEHRRERGEAFEMLAKDQDGIKVDTSVTWYASRRGSSEVNIPKTAPRTSHSVERKT